MIVRKKDEDEKTIDINNWALGVLRLSGNASLTGMYISILLHTKTIGYDEENRAIYKNPIRVGLKAISKEAGASYNTTKKHIELLEKLNLIKITKRTGKATEIYIVDAK